LDSIKEWITKLKLPQNLSRTAQQHQAQPSLQHPSKGLDSSKLERHLVQHNYFYTNLTLDGRHLVSYIKGVKLTITNDV